MNKLTKEEILNLTFGNQIKIIYHNSKYHHKNETYKAVVYGNKIGYENGFVDYLKIIAEQAFEGECKVYLTQCTKNDLKGR